MASGFQLVPITSQKHDPAWKHCQMYKNGDRTQLKCIYCSKIFKGGGIHRIKEHLAGHKGNASTCPRVPPDVRDLMLESLEGVMVKKRKKQNLDEEITDVNVTNADMEAFSSPGIVNAVIQPIEVVHEPHSGFLMSNEDATLSNRSLVRRKKGRGKSSSAANDAIVMTNTNSVPPASTHFSPASTHVGSTHVNNQVHMAIGRFLYDVGVSLEAVNSVYFQPMIDAITAGEGFITPSYHDLRGSILKNSVEEVKNEIESIKATWGRTGCSVVVDEWRTETGRITLSFLVYCPEGIVFLESVDASEIVGSPEDLYELLKKVVEEVGVRHVLQVITRSGDHYIAAGRKLTDTYPTLYWSPCATHCINLILDDFANIESINTVIEQARSVTRYVYNNSGVLNMVRRYTFGKDILVLGITQSASNFTTLRRIVDFKLNLQSMVTSQEWMDCPYSKKPGGLEMLDVISSQSFWSSCILITRLTDPLLRLLRIVCSKKKPAMGYIYAGMYRAKERIKSEFVKRQDYMVYWNIIDRRWQQQWDHPLHAAGFYLNPKFFYSIEGDMHSEIQSGMFDCIERLVSDTKIQDRIIKEMSLYKNAAGDLGRKMAIRARDTLLPAEWWSTYGGGCPNLARLAVRILSQTCSSIRCKRNQIHFEKMHETSNHLERQRLNDLLFVHHNLRLRQTTDSGTNEQDPLDPISLDGRLGVFEDWVSKKGLSCEDYENSDWKALDPPPVAPMPLRQSSDDAEDLGAGFDDYEIFRRLKESEEENALVNAENQ